MTTLPSWLLPALASVLIAILLALLSLVINITRDVATCQTKIADHSETLKCIPDLMRNQDRMLFRQETEDRVMLKQARDEIHSPTHHERDTLVDKMLLTKDITAAETTELIWRLELAMSQETEPYRKLYVGMLLTQAYMQQEHFDEKIRAKLGEPCKGAA
jgi:hypothetical protein